MLREENGLGGSEYLHQNLQVGNTLLVKGPRNHFPFDPAKRHVFIAGGIGITPIKPMLEMAKKLGVDYRLIFLGRSRKSMAFVDDMCAEHPTRRMGRVMKAGDSTCHCLYATRSTGQQTVYASTAAVPNSSSLAWKKPVQISQRLCSAWNDSRLLRMLCFEKTRPLRLL